MEILPPPEYDRAYSGQLTVRYGSLAEIKHFCHTRQGIVSAFRVYGCAKAFDTHCFIMIPKTGGPVSARMQSAIRRHEVAHCNGWAANHPR